MLELYLVRHGETDQNRRGLYHGWADAPLTEKGIAQAEEAGEKLKNCSLDLIISSDLSRTYETAQRINIYHGITIEKQQAFREMNFGLWEGMSYHQLKEMYPMELEAWEKDWLSYPIPEGESIKEMYARVKKALGRLLQETSHKRILIVSHGGTIRTILCHLIGSGLEDYWRYKIENGRITKIEIVDGYAVLAALNQ